MVLREKTYEIIKSRIVTGVYRPGQPLNEKAIIEELKISRTPFREAVNALNEENLVQIYPNRGIFVRELTLQDVLNGFDIRLLLEPYIAELACVRMPKNIAQQLIDRIDQIDHSNYMALMAEDDHFHNTLLAYTDNRQLTRIMTNLYEYNHIQVMLMDDHASEYARKERTKHVIQSLTEHRTALTRMLEGDVAGASEAIREHIQNARARALQ